MILNSIQTAVRHYVTQKFISVWSKILLRKPQNKQTSTVVIVLRFFSLWEVCEIFTTPETIVQGCAVLCKQLKLMSYKSWNVWAWRTSFFFSLSIIQDFLFHHLQEGIRNEHVTSLSESYEWKSPLSSSFSYNFTHL